MNIFIFCTESKVTLSSNFREDNIKDDKRKERYVHKENEKIV